MQACESWMNCMLYTNVIVVNLLQDNQVPVCPLCNKPIPVKPGLAPDVEVGRHIDTDCQSDPAKERRGKVYSNKCSKKGCKTKEVNKVQKN